MNRSCIQGRGVVLALRLFIGLSLALAGCSDAPPQDFAAFSLDHFHVWDCGYEGVWASFGTQGSRYFHLQGETPHCRVWNDSKYWRVRLRTHREGYSWGYALLEAIPQGDK